MNNSTKCRLTHARSVSTMHVVTLRVIKLAFYNKTIHTFIYVLFLHLFAGIVLTIHGT